MRITTKLADKISKMDRDDRVDVIVKLHAFDKDLLREIIRLPSVSIHHVIKMTGVVSISLPVGWVNALSREPWVERVEEDETVYAVINKSVPTIGASFAWEKGVSGKGVKLAIIDTGIDESHPDFANRIVAVKDFTHEGFKDSNGHGSLVAGVATGSGAYSGGKFKGVAPNALILSGKVLEADGSGKMSSVMAAIEWAVELGADIINLSLSTSSPSDGNDALCEICDVAVESGVVVCVAAGNDGPAKSTMRSPASSRLAITVGATNANGFIAEFSSRGPTEDDRIKPEVVAPGVDVISVRARDTRAGKPLDDYYTSATGTSMAVPHVSGLVALLLEVNRKASPQLIRETLINTATDLNLDDYSQGAGMVTVEAALRYVRAHENPPDPIAQSPTGSAFLSAVSEVYEFVTHRTQNRKS